VEKKVAICGGSGIIDVITLMRCSMDKNPLTMASVYASYGWTRFMGTGFFGMA
jgi:hypothetical protein